MNGSVVAAVAICMMSTSGAAQSIPRLPRVFAESRADAIVGKGTTAQVGVGPQIPLGYYVRLGLTGAFGITYRDGNTLTSARGDLMARYLLDPFRETPWALSLGGGVSVPYVDGDARTRPYVTIVVDVEGPRSNGVSPAFQLGLGGGARFGVAFRTSPGPWR